MRWKTFRAKQSWTVWSQGIFHKISPSPKSSWLQVIGTLRNRSSRAWNQASRCVPSSSYLFNFFFPFRLYSVSRACTEQGQHVAQRQVATPESFKSKTSTFDLRSLGGRFWRTEFFVSVLQRSPGQKVEWQNIPRFLALQDFPQKSLLVH